MYIKGEVSIFKRGLFYYNGVRYRASDWAPHEDAPTIGTFAKQRIFVGASS
jgi:hypothetical protein